MKDVWYMGNYRRNLIDMHIEDWHEEFLSKLEVENYISMLKRSKVQTAMIYANSHVGLCYWPTKHGEMHRGLHGEDFLGKMIQRCHEENLAVVVYFSLIFDNWAYKNHPSWRIVNEFGMHSRDKSENAIFAGNKRYGVCCPNNKDYREYVMKQLQELCTTYDFEGMFLDMTYWPAICYCSACKDRYEKEIGGEMPRIVNWSDPKWVEFQRKREEWIVEFAHFATDCVKQVNPKITIEHQYSTALSGWKAGVTEDLTYASDYAGGDLYGGFTQQSFACKLYHNLTVNQPFEYMTSRCDPNLRYHTSTKSKQSLELHNYISLAHNGAFLFIDAIDPVGTLNTDLYNTMGEIFGKSMLYEPYLGGKLCRDVAIYFSLGSKINLEANGKPVTETVHGIPHLDAAIGAAKTFSINNIPYDVISKRNLNEINDCQVLVVPNVYLMTDEEAKSIRDFVKQGGSLYISGIANNGIIMKEMLGIEHIGYTEEEFTYIAPVEDKNDIDFDIIKPSPLTVNGRQSIVKAENEDEVVANIVLPYTDPGDFTIFASIHSNPPGRYTQYPAIIYKNYGKGKIVWVAAPIEENETYMSRRLFLNLIKKLLAKPVCFTSNAPAPVEILLFDQKENNRYIINLINEQEYDPLVPVYNIQVSVRMDGKKAVKAHLMPDMQEMELKSDENYATITIPKLEVFNMVLLDYSKL